MARSSDLYMAKAVFTQKPDSIYDDLPEKHYQFPKTYLNKVKQALGDWVVYYRPKRGSVASGKNPASAYFAIAKLVDITLDTDSAELYYAKVSDYLEFDNSVSFRREEGSYEAAVLKADGSVNKGAFGRSVRVMSDNEFNLILAAGFTSGLRPWESVSEFPDHNEIDRPLIERVSKRYFRDRRFRLAVCDAYRNTCAVTGLALINGGGRPEVQAAHIQPVEHYGPDSIRNGIALSGTAHWMFDRGLITLDEHLCVVASSSLDDAMHHGLVVPGKKISLPDELAQRPSNHFLEFHRQNIFHE